MVGISTGFVCHGQYWLVYQSVLSVVDNIGCYIFQFCLDARLIWVKHNCLCPFVFECFHSSERNLSFILHDHEDQYNDKQTAWPSLCYSLIFLMLNAAEHELFPVSQF